MKYDKSILDPLISLKSKSEKAILKLHKDTWQHRMVENNISALQIAISLMNGENVNISKEKLQAIITAFDDMIDRTEKAKNKFAEGKSQHTLQKNRLNSLVTAKIRVCKQSASFDDLHEGAH